MITVTCTLLRDFQAIDHRLGEAPGRCGTVTGHLRPLSAVVDVTQCTRRASAHGGPGGPGPAGLTRKQLVFRCIRLNRTMVLSWISPGQCHSTVTVTVKADSGYNLKVHCRP
jgi:hypothetical protein